MARRHFTNGTSPRRCQFEIVRTVTLNLQASSSTGPRSLGPSERPSRSAFHLSSYLLAFFFSVTRPDVAPAHASYIHPVFFSSLASLRSFPLRSLPFPFVPLRSLTFLKKFSKKLLTTFFTDRRRIAEWHSAVSQVGNLLGGRYQHRARPPLEPQAVPARSPSCSEHPFSSGLPSRPEPPLCTWPDGLLNRENSRRGGRTNTVRPLKDA
jgi:hypothetical protein